MGNKKEQVPKILLIMIFYLFTSCQSGKEEVIEYWNSETPKITRTNNYFRYYYENGNLEKEGIQNEGNPVGYWVKYYENGIIEKKAIYKSWDHIEESEAFDKQGRLRESWSFLSDGVWENKTFHANGNLRSIGKSESEKNVGEWKSFSEDGTLVKIEFYDNEGEIKKLKTF